MLLHITICSPDPAGLQILLSEIVTFECDFRPALSPGTAGSGAWVVMWNSSNLLSCPLGGFDFSSWISYKIIFSLLFILFSSPIHISSRRSRDL